VTTWTATAPEAVRTLRTNRETTPEGFHDEVLSDHIPPTRKTNQQVSAPPTHPGAEDGTSQEKVTVAYQGSVYVSTAKATMTLKVTR